MRRLWPARSLFAFIAGHGVLEISAIVLAGAGGFVIANALLNPGPYSRGDALARHGPDAVRMAVACVPALITSGCIEAFISPSHFPVWFKVTVGLTPRPFLLALPAGDGEARGIVACRGVAAKERKDFRCRHETLLRGRW
ncbi:MAG: stage II sporulation protein M [Verrucomicrobiota bacterium]